MCNQSKGCPTKTHFEVGTITVRQSLNLTFARELFCESVDFILYHAISFGCRISQVAISYGRRILQHYQFSPKSKAHFHYEFITLFCLLHLSFCCKFFRALAIPFSITFSFNVWSCCWMCI